MPGSLCPNEGTNARPSAKEFGLRDPMRREALYNLVWAVPVSKLARQFQLSDRGLAKLCHREGIPVPPRGYWAKLAAGHSVTQTPLPEPVAGRSPWISVAPKGSDYGAEGRAWLAKHTAAPPLDDAPSPHPEAPVHNHDVHVVAWRARSAVGNVRVRKRELQSAVHPTIARLLTDDREAWERQRSRYLGYHEKRQFAGAGPRRRLGLLNALLLALEKAGARADVADREGRAIIVTVGRMVVRCLLESTWMRTTRSTEREERLDFHVYAGGNSNASRFAWKERRGLVLESCLAEIATGILVAAELEQRDREWQYYNHLLRLRAEAFREQERQREKRRQEARDRLITDANHLRQADAIRSLVAAARRELNADSVEFGRWQCWALTEAEALDPIRSGGLVLAVPD